MFEADHPATQAWKREALQLAGIPVPGNVRFCPVDLEIGSLPQALAAASFQSGTLTFVSWLGGTQYLSEAAIDSTLGFVRSLPPGSEIVFSLVVPDTWLDQDRRQEVEGLADAAASGGEPWITRLDPTVVRSAAPRHGIRLRVSPDARVRDGALFVHPARWAPGLPRGPPNARRRVKPPPRS